VVEHDAVIRAGKVGDVTFFNVQSSFIMNIFRQKRVDTVSLFKSALPYPAQKRSASAANIKNAVIEIYAEPLEPFGEFRNTVKTSP
jgi:hypothetical protein